MNKLFLCLFIWLPLLAPAQKHTAYPANVATNLKKAGKNRPELEKAIIHYQNLHDPLKLKAIYFLIANMDIHYAANYYWVDAKGNKVEYSELNYPDFATAQKAFDELKQHTPNIHPKPVINQDLEIMKADYLIDNVDKAFKTWKASSAKNISFSDFCEYILPYRVSIEPVQNWRGTYFNAYQKYFKALPKSGSSVYNFITDKGDAFVNSFSLGVRTEPLPRLGSLQLLLRKTGACEDIADFKAFTLRSLGLPAWVENVPYWGTSSGRHFFAATFTNNAKAVSLDVPQDLKREPSKILRTTYSKQPGVLASLIKADEIPPGFMRTYNYKDVTKEYWPTKNLSCNLFPAPTMNSIVYACVFNFSSWRPTWWAKATGQRVLFSNMSKGVVFLPAYYVGGKLKPAGYPVALGFNHEMELKPDWQQAHAITINAQAKFLTIKSRETYKLYYWDNSWKLLKSILTSEHQKTLAFEKVPANALLLLRPQASQGKERPFIVTNEGQRIWW